MPKPRPRCVIHCSYGPPRPASALKFAVVNEDMLAVSGVWTVSPHSNRDKVDIFVTSTGMTGSAKVSFHGDVINHSWLFESHGRLVSEGLARDGSRHIQSLPIPQLPWHGLTIRFPDVLLRKEGYSLDGIKGDVLGLPAPGNGYVLDVGFVVAQGPEIQVDGAQFAIAEIGGGGRALLVVGRYSAQDTAHEKEKLREEIHGMPVPAVADAKLTGNELLAALMFSEQNGAIVVTEVHNVRVIKGHALS